MIRLWFLSLGQSFFDRGLASFGGLGCDSGSYHEPSDEPGSGYVRL